MWSRSNVNDLEAQQRAISSPTPLSTQYGAKAYLKAGAVFVVTTATFLLAKTTGWLPSWRWSSGDNATPQSEPGKDLVTYETTGTALNIISPEATALSFERSLMEGSTSMEVLGKSEALFDKSVTFEELPLSSPESSSSRKLLSLDRTAEDPKPSHTTALPTKTPDSASGKKKRMKKMSVVSEISMNGPTLGEQVVTAEQEFRIKIPGYVVGEDDKTYYFGSMTATQADGSPLPSWLQLVPPSIPFTPTLLSNYDTLSARGVAVTGNLALVANGNSGLLVINITDPSAPGLLGNYDTPGYAKGVALAGNLALVADDISGLQIINITDPRAPSLLGSDSAGVVYGVAVARNLALVLNNHGLRIIDITDPRDSSFLGSYYIAMATVINGITVYDVAVQENLALVASGALYIIDITDPRIPSLLGNYPSINAEGVTVAGNLALVADFFGLKIINITDPRVPSLLGNYPGYARRVTVAGDLALVAYGTDGLHIINITDPRVPTLLGNYNTPGYARGVAVAGNLALVADDISGLQAIDLSQWAWELVGLPPLSQREIWSFKIQATAAPDLAYQQLISMRIQGKPILQQTLPNLSVKPGQTLSYRFPYQFVTDAEDEILLTNMQVSLANGLTLPSWISTAISPLPIGNYNTRCYDVAVSGNLALVSADLDYVQVINISDPKAPTMLGSLFIYLPSQDVAVAENLALVADIFGLRIINITDPKTPIQLRIYSTPDITSGVAILGNLVLVADSGSGLQIIDITNPTEPSLLGNYDTSGTAYGVAVQENLALVADNTNGLQLINITNPREPSLLGNYDTPGEALDVVISGNLALVADGSSGLQIINITDPKMPTWVGSYNTPSYAYGVAVTGNLALMADGFSGFHIINITDPKTPTLLGSNGLDTVYDVTVARNLALVADGDSGLQIIDIGLSAWVLSATPSTGTHVKYTLAATVYDSDGAFITVPFGLGVTNPPIWQTPISRQLVNIDQLLSFSLPPNCFIDPDADTLSFTSKLANGESLPSWLSFAPNPFIQLYTGIPQISDRGTYNITITADDGYYATANAWFTLVVNTPPIVNQLIPGQIVQILQSYNYTIPSTTFVDADGNNLSYRLARNDRLLLPNWLQFNGTTGYFSGVPSASDRGMLDLAVTADDGVNGIVQTSFLLRINTPPVILLPLFDQRANVGNIFSYHVAETTFGDADGDVLTATSTRSNGQTLPSWLSFLSNPSSQVYTGFPQATDRGNYTIRLTANDGYGGVVFSDFNLLINTQPLLKSTITRQIVQVGQPYVYTLPVGLFEDVDGGSLTYAANLASGASLPAWLAFNGTTLTGTPASTSLAGTYMVFITADDNQGGEATMSFALQVNTPPQSGLALPEQSITIGTVLDLILPESLFVGTNLDLSVTLESGAPIPGWLNFDSTTRRFNGMPPQGSKGELKLRITATDETGASTSQVIGIKIPNQPPEKDNDIPSQEAAIWRLFEYIVPSTTFKDLDGDVLTYRARLKGESTLPSWLSFNPLNRQFAGEPGITSTSDLTVELIASDGEAETSTDIRLLMKTGTVLEDLAKYYSASGAGLVALGLIARFWRWYAMQDVQAAFKNISEKPKTAEASATNEGKRTPEQEIKTLQADSARKKAVEEELKKLRLIVQHRENDALLAQVAAYQRAALEYIKTGSKRSVISIGNLWDVIKEICEEIENRALRKRDCEEIEPLAKALQQLLQLVVMTEHGRAVLRKDKEYLLSILKKAKKYVDSKKIANTPLKHALELSQEALVCLDDTDSFDDCLGCRDLTMLFDVLKTLAAPPYGVWRLLYQVGNIPGDWYPKVVRLGQLAEQAIDKPESATQLQLLLWKQTDWRVIYHGVGLLGKVGRETQAESIRRQVIDYAPKGDQSRPQRWGLKNYEHFAPLWLQSYTPSCKQGRDYLGCIPSCRPTCDKGEDRRDWIRARANDEIRSIRKEDEAATILLSTSSSKVKFSETKPLPNATATFVELVSPINTSSSPSSSSASSLIVSTDPIASPIFSAGTAAGATLAMAETKMVTETTTTTRLTLSAP